MLRAGAGMLDITPEAGTHLAGAGFGEYRPAEVILDRLFARAVVIESEKTAVCLVTLDVTIITGSYCRKIRQAVSDQFGFPLESILVHATQTHSAPAIGGFMFDPDLPLELTAETEFLSGATTGYSEFASDQAIKAVILAVEQMRPASIGIGRSIADHLAFNRRLVTRSGEAAMPGLWSSSSDPLGPTHLLHYEGPTDPEVDVLCLQDESMRMIAMLLHFSCHPVNIFVSDNGWHAVSADWPGAWADNVQRAYGQTCVPLVLNGCCGNINPWDPFLPDYIPDHLRMGSQLYKVTRKIIDTMHFDKESAIDFCFEKLALDYRAIPQNRLDEVESMLKKHPQVWFSDLQQHKTDLDWFLAASTRSIEYCKKRMPRFPYEIQVIRIGNLAVVGWPGEPFIEGQLDLKIKSPAEFTMVAHCTSQYVGYIPALDAYPRGGHEANFECTYWSKLAPGSLEKIVEATKKMIRCLYPG